MDVQTIKIVRQIVNGDQPVYIGVERDNKVRQVTFEGVPVLGDAQLVSLYWTLATPIETDLGPIDLPSYYPYTRVLVSGDYPPDVTATCKIVDTSL